MKITHITGETVDTDALPDTEAMVLEKVEEFRLFCLKNKVPFLMFVDPKGVISVSAKFYPIKPFEEKPKTNIPLLNNLKEAEKRVEEKETSVEKIEDFGEKIEGARKDQIKKIL